MAQAVEIALRRNCGGRENAKMLCKIKLPYFFNDFFFKFRDALDNFFFDFFDKTNFQGRKQIEIDFSFVQSFI